MSQRTGHKRPDSSAVTLPLLAVLCLISGYTLPDREAALGREAADPSSGPVREGILTADRQVQNGALPIGAISTMEFVPLPPALLPDGPERWIMEQVYGPGLILPPLNGVIEPGLIQESDGFSEVGTNTFTFTLRSDIRFHSDDLLLTPQHVKDTYEFYKELATSSFSFPEIDPAFALIDSIRIDEESNQVIIEMPSTLREQLLRIAATAPLHPRFLEINEGESPDAQIRRTAWPSPPGLGAYQALYIEDSNTVTLVEHREYFEDRPNIRNITVRFYDSDGDLNRAFITGDVKLVRLPTLKAYGTVLNQWEQSDPTARQVTSPNIRYYRQPNHFFYLAFNTTREPLNSPYMRRAVAFAIKRTDHDFRDEPPYHSIITDLPLHPDSRLGQRFPGQSQRPYAPRSQSLRQIREDPDINATRTGYPRDREWQQFQLELIYPGHVSHYETMARRIKNHLENLQIQVEVTEVTPAELRRRIHSGDYQMAISEMTLPPTVDALQRLFWSRHARGGLNFTRYVNPAFDAAVQGAISHREGQRTEYNWRYYAGNCVRILYEDIPLLPLFFQTNQYYFFDNSIVDVEFLGPIGQRLAPMHEWRRK